MKKVYLYFDICYNWGGKEDDRMKDIRVVFMGTPSFAVPIVSELISKYKVVLVVCQPDREKDRKGRMVLSPVKEVALKNNIPVFQPNRIREDYETILEYKPDIIVTCAYGQIVPEVILNYPKYGCINVHGSLLPALRGGAPIHWAIINGDKTTGVTIMKMALKMDAGDIISQRQLEILDDDILDDVYEKLSYVGRDLLMETLPSIIEGTCSYVKQDEGLVTFGLNVRKEDEKIDFSKKALEIRNLVRGLNSIPGAYCNWNGKRMKVYEVEVLNGDSQGKPGEIVEVLKDGLVVNTGDKLLKIRDIKLEGKKRCLVSNFLNGIEDKENLVGEVLY